MWKESNAERESQGHLGDRWKDQRHRETERDMRRLRGKKTEKHGSKDSRRQSHRERNAEELS